MADRRRAGMLGSAAAGDEVAFQQIIVEHHDDMRRVARPPRMQARGASN